MPLFSKIKVGLFGIGLNTYWRQFDGLFERLKSYQELIGEKISKYGVEVINVGIVDTPQKAIEESSILKKSDVEIIFLYISTYALSSTVLPCDKLNSKSTKILSTKNSFLARLYFLPSIVRLPLFKIRLTKSVLEGLIQGSGSILMGDVD